MHILFLCKGNVARSQAAEEFLKRISDDEVRSAGISPSKLAEWPTVGLIEGAKEILQVMKEEGIDISNNRRKMLSEDDVKWADRIYVMADKADMPEFVLASGKAELWDILDPKGKNLEETRRIIAQVKEKVSAIVRVTINP